MSKIEVGNAVRVNYLGEGTYHVGHVTSLSDDGRTTTIRYKHFKFVEEDVIGFKSWSDVIEKNPDLSDHCDQ